MNRSCQKRAHNLKLQNELMQMNDVNKSAADPLDDEDEIIAESPACRGKSSQSQVFYGPETRSAYRRRRDLRLQNEQMARNERIQEIKRFPKVLQKFQDPRKHNISQVRESMDNSQKVLDQVIKVASSALMVASSRMNDPEVMDQIRLHGMVVREFKNKLKKIMDKDLNESMNKSLNKSLNNSSIIDEIGELFEFLDEESPSDAAELNESLNKMGDPMKLLSVMDEILNKSQEFVDLMNESGYSTEARTSWDSESSQDPCSRSEESSTRPRIVGVTYKKNYIPKPPRIFKYVRQMDSDFPAQPIAKPPRKIPFDGPTFCELYQNFVEKAEAENLN